MYCGEIDNKYISLAWKLGLHPSTLGSYFGKLLELLLKGAKVDGCKPSFSARLSPKLSISPQYIQIAYYNCQLQRSVVKAVHWSKR
jgi:hypothetical protein